MTQKARIGLLAASLCVATIFAVPAARAGEPDCTLASQVMTLNLDAEFRNVRLYVQKDTIFVQSGFTTYTCDGATVNNTDKIRIIDTVPDSAANVEISHHAERFAPGFTDEDGSSDEIEFIVKLGTGDNRFQAEGGFTPERPVNFRAGTAVIDGTPRREINLNAGETSHVDHDVVVKGSLFEFGLWGSPLDDILGAHGGAGTGGPFRGSVSMYSGVGIDVVTGGLGDDSIFTGNLKCSECFPDADRAFGGPGDDHIRGGKASDKLHGEGGSDTIEGGEGNDDLFGGGGSDTLSGEEGDDELDGGDGLDECQGGPGADSLDSCESVQI